MSLEQHIESFVGLSILQVDISSLPSAFSYLPVFQNEVQNRRVFMHEIDERGNFIDVKN